MHLSVPNLPEFDPPSRVRGCGCAGHVTEGARIPQGVRHGDLAGLVSTIRSRFGGSHFPYILRRPCHVLLVVKSHLAKHAIDLRGGHVLLGALDETVELGRNEPSAGRQTSRIGCRSTQIENWSGRPSRRRRRLRRVRRPLARVRRGRRVAHQRDCARSNRATVLSLWLHRGCETLVLDFETLVLDFAVTPVDRWSDVAGSDESRGP